MVAVGVILREVAPAVVDPLDQLQVGLKEPVKDIKKLLVSTQQQEATNLSIAKIEV